MTCARVDDQEIFVRDVNRHIDWELDSPAADAVHEGRRRVRGLGGFIKIQRDAGVTKSQGNLGVVKSVGDVGVTESLGNSRVIEKGTRETLRVKGTQDPTNHIY